MISHNAERNPALGGSVSFMQMRPKAGEGSPEWYAPNRDLLHQFPKWLSQALKRLDSSNPVGDGEGALEVEGAKSLSKELANFINAVSRGDLAGKPEEVKALLTELKSNEEVHASLAAAVLTHLLWTYWEFAGDVSLRKEGPLKT
jgi:hypothetical protein